MKLKQTKTVDDRPLHVRLRPSSLDEVIGQDAVVSSLKSVLKKSRPHTFLLTGPAGVGKTTIGRIIAREVGVEEKNIVEIDAATHSGAEAMRDLTERSSYQALGSSANRMFLIDEVHRLSATAFDALLKATEEPPEHAYWCMCTTDPSKIPRTLVTRCHSYELKPFRKDLLRDYLEFVRNEEGMDAADEVLGYISDAANGSLRQALVMLSMARDCATRKEAVELLAGVDEGSADVIELVRMLATGKGLSWGAAMKLLERTDASAEGVRLTLVNYLSKALLGTTDGKQAVRYLQVLSCFSQPYASAEKHAPLMLSIGQLLFQPED